MYKIIGADQREYGPVTAEELRRWIAEGRANAQTPVRAEAAAEWKPLGTFPEFAAAFAPVPLVSPPPFSPVPGGGNVPGKTNGIAIGGFALSVLGLFCCGPLFSTLGLIFSCIALGQIRQSPAQDGRNLAVAGIILAILSYLFWAAIICAAFFGGHGFHGSRLYNL